MKILKLIRFLNADATRKRMRVPLYTTTDYLVFSCLALSLRLDVRSPIGWLRHLNDIMSNCRLSIRPKIINRSNIHRGRVFFFSFDDRKIRTELLSCLVVSPFSRIINFKLQPSIFIQKTKLKHFILQIFRFPNWQHWKSMDRNHNILHHCESWLHHDHNLSKVGTESICVRNPKNIIWSIGMGTGKWFSRVFIRTFRNINVERLKVEQFYSSKCAHCRAVFLNFS